MTEEQSNVEPALHPDTIAIRSGRADNQTALAPVLWAMAMRGAREALLPEIAGQAAYRVAPGVSFDGLDLPAVLARCITRLRRQTCNLREICEWPGIDRSRAQRLLNAVYLQAGLIISRTHPAATNEGWAGYR